MHMEPYLATGVGFDSVLICCGIFNCSTCKSHRDGAPLHCLHSSGTLKPNGNCKRCATDCPVRAVSTYSLRDQLVMTPEELTAQ